MTTVVVVNLPVFSFISPIHPINPALADELDELLRLKEEKEAQKNAKEAEKNQVAQQEQAVVGEINETEGAIVETEGEISEKEQKIDSLEQQKQTKEQTLSEKEFAQAQAFRAIYKLSRLHPAEFFLSQQGGLKNLSRFWQSYEQSLNSLLARIIDLNGQILSLQADLGITTNQKAQLEGTVAVLGEQKEQLTEQKEVLADQRSGLEQQVQHLENEIAQLTARQQEILAARSGSFTTSVGDVPITDDFNASPAYNPGFSPAFAAFSFGAYTHRKGMSQYGAKGRAEQGQSYHNILHDYYGKEVTTKDTSGGIWVEGYGELNFEDYYLMGIAEMPSTFPFEALKAQAIAARSYAWRYKEQGSSICTTQSCQVFLGSKANNPPEEWKRAVQETRGQIIEGVVTYYSSTTGGYLTTMGWDTTDGNGGGDWTNRAYEAIGKSPWFYKSWYTKDYYLSSGTCGRSHPWLTEEEMADILNAYVVLSRGDQADVDRILPTTGTQCAVGGSGGNPFSHEELRNKANSLGEMYTSVSGVSTIHSNNGETAQVTFQTNRGSVSISGSEFKQAFNLRAPGYISIRSPLYQVEKK